MSAILGQILTVIGLITAVGGPVLAALLANPMVASHAQLVYVLGIIGVVITALGVAHDALANWVRTNAETQLKIQEYAVGAQMSDIAMGCIPIGFGIIFGVLICWSMDSLIRYRDYRRDQKVRKYLDKLSNQQIREIQQILDIPESKEKTKS